MEARVPIRYVPPWSCAQRMERGDVRRHAARGQLFACVVACPGCPPGRAVMIEAAAAGLEEGPLVREATAMTPGGPAVPWEHPTELRGARPVRCHGCGGRLRFEGAVLSCGREVA